MLLKFYKVFELCVKWTMPSGCGYVVEGFKADYQRIRLMKLNLYFGGISFTSGVRIVSVNTKLD